ncbi:SDR family oxidoreductase [Bythopirellula goksoeyrii]|uniref:Diacetyl reductase [(S)-acetoin forming] n=1 Tax=Bythopirellula goksoeyrii TaxID=1400387 RepID=A0A5B9QB91_9BACT|nr:SDR family oxidoreductase [Bythopirellula goksoeyrii]QEG34845.1 Diacetyl reductase [(S)-acetoin forming] [Bythopirellula goksoeyrii]
MNTPARTVFVTGCSTGIGRATALLLAEKGFRVFAGLRGEQQAAELENASKGSLTTILLDVTQEDQIASAVATIQAACPEGLYALVNNAGVALAAATELTTADELRKVLEVNVVAPLRMIQHCLPMLRQTHGRIINVSSMNGTQALPMVGAYSASKHALEAINDTLRVELRPWRIKLSLIRPGQVRTPIFHKSHQQIEERRDKIPPELCPTYSEFYTRAAEFNERGAKSRTSPEDVARVIHRVLKARWPRVHYHVGLDAHGMNLLRYVHPKLVDRVLARVMGLFHPVD